MSSSMTQEQLHAKLNPCEQYGVVDLSEEEESLGDEEARVIAEFLRSDSRVKLLNLCDNGEITDVGAAALSEMLRANRTLEMLFLKRGKGIGKQGGLSFLKVLVETPACKAYVNLDMCDGVPEEVVKLVAAVGFSRQDQTSPLYKPLSPEDLQAIAALLGS